MTDYKDNNQNINPEDNNTQEIFLSSDKESQTNSNPQGSDTSTNNFSPSKSYKKITAVALVGIATIAGGVGAFIGVSFALNHQNATNFSTSSRPPSHTVTINNSGSKFNISAIAAKVDPSVVDITSTLGYQGGTAAGTGMIITSSGEVLTNNHVVEGATNLTVKIDGKGPVYKAKVIGTDLADDVALIQIKGVSGLPTVKLGNSSNVRVGQRVVAIGNALNLPGSPTVTAGTISALNRSITAANGYTSEHLKGMIQTDAPINPGNSGGPLLNSSGQVIGMNTAAATGTSSQPGSNIGFAIPINRAVNIVNQIRKGQNTSQIKIGVPAFLGVEIMSPQAANSNNPYGFANNIPTTSGAYIGNVLNGTPAASIGLSSGDVITSFNHQTITSPSSLTAAISKLSPGQRVPIKWVGPSGNTHNATVKLAAGPAQ